MPKYTWVANDKTRSPEKPKPKTIVCVTDQFTCDTHIKAGRVLADLTDTELVVVHISSPTAVGEGKTIDYLYSVARENNAMMQVLFEKDADKSLIRFIKNCKAKYLITGLPEGRDSIPPKLWSKFTHISFYTVDGAGTLEPVKAPRRTAEALQNAAPSVASC